MDRDMDTARSNLALDNKLAECEWDKLELTPNTKAFLKRVYANGIAKYERRLVSLGFRGGMRALDAGCGLGQWSLALTGLCNEVYGIDVSSERIDACNVFANKLGLTNVHFMQGGLETLPFQDAYFDRVICYSVIQITDYVRSIEELARVTKSGGVIYISTNGIGRYIYDIVKRPNLAPDFDPRVFGVKTIINTMLSRRHNLSSQNGAIAMGQERTVSLLQSSGFEIIDSNFEGKLLDGSESFLLGSYWGLTATFDILARKI